MSQTIPTTQKAVLSDKDKRVLTTQPVATPSAGEVLIKNVAVASNPKDWKMPIYIPNFPWPAVEGNDVAGTVAAVGPDVKDFKVGDKVAAFTKMATDTKFGAYQEYSIAPVHQTFHLSESASFEGASTLPLAVMTAALGLFVHLGLPTPLEKAKEETWIFVNGGSSSVGHFTIQLAKIAGLKVATTAGASQKVPQEAGADVIIDYRGKSDEEVAQAINAATGGKIRHVYDAISEESSQQTNFHILKENGGKVTVVLPPTDKNVPSNVQVIRTYVGTAYGEHQEFATKYYKLIGELFNSGELKANKVTIIPGGLAGVDEGIKLLLAHKVSGEKLVYRIAETPGL